MPPPPGSNPPASPRKAARAAAPGPRRVRPPGCRARNSTATVVAAPRPMLANHRDHRFGRLDFPPGTGLDLDIGAQAPLDKQGKGLLERRHGRPPPIRPEPSPGVE